jgi:hypothetical protein
MLIHPAQLGKNRLKSACLHFPNRDSVVARTCATFWGICVSQFLSMLLLATSLTLTLCFGVAAWRASSDKNADITGTILHQYDARR